MSLNWSKIKSEYINGYISQSKLAEKYGIAWQTLRDRASREKWTELRKVQREKIGKKTAEKTAEKISEQEADLAANIHSAANELLRKLNIAIQQTDIYIEKTKTRVPKKVKDKKTGEVYTAWKEEEEIRLSKKDGINASTVKQLASALKDLQSIQLAGREEQVTESPTINIAISAATPDDIGVDEE